METAVQLPPVATGYVRIGWSGFALALPESWNLSLHSPARGMHRQGLLVFSDLRGPALEIRWQTPRRLKVLAADPQRALARVVGRLRKNGKVEAIGRAFLVRDGSGGGRGGMVLAADRTRLYELHSPRFPDSLESITRDFLVCLDRLGSERAGGGAWLWSVYGMEAWLPAAARLRQISLKPGDCRLTFQLPAAKTGAVRGPGTLTIAGLSLAQQVLRDRSLRVWASAELAQVRACPGGQWEESGHEATWKGDSRRLGRVLHHETHLRHDPAKNRIHWTHLARRGKN